jgi:nucleoside-diphosphate-sugar epimerase
MTQKRVLVTGGSGFIAGHCILQLLEQGYLVRTTIRSLNREATVRSVLADAGMLNGDALTFVEADLMDDAGWPAAVADMDFVLHVASPVRPGLVDNADDLIIPAREGTLRVLRAARDAGVARVVLTSAFHAVGWGHPHDDRVFTEADWTVVGSPEVDAYGASKTLAERAAWEFVRSEGGSTELVTMLPVAVMGPALGQDVSGSNMLVKRILDGDIPGFPDLYFPVVDVRDVAAAHILAMTEKRAAGERFLIANGPAIAMKDLGAWIRADLGAAAPHVPKRAIPSAVVRAGALFNPEMRHILPELGYVRRPSNAKARHVLGWQPRPSHNAVIAAARSLVTKGLVKK